MTVPEFVIRTQERCKSGSIGAVELDLGECGKWRIDAQRVECLRLPTKEPKE